MTPLVRIPLLVVALVAASPVRALHGPGDPILYEDGFECRNWFADADMDGFGDPDVFVFTCTPPADHVYNALDCDDGSAGINPAADDLPDPAFGDTDCDGIDGDEDRAVFVAASGADDAGCGTTATPCATIATGIARAVSRSKRDVYVAGGTYASAPFFLASGINVFGGFGANFQRDPLLATGSRVADVSGAPAVQVFPGELQAATVVADGLTAPTTLADLTLRGVNAAAAGAGRPGNSSYVVVARGLAPGLLTITRNTIVAGAGSAGAAGTAGPSASASAAPGGSDGVNGGESGAVRLGGNGGTNAACLANTSGGRGGDGGDTGGQFGGSATAGQAGQPGAQAGGAFGGGGSAGAASGSGQAGNGGPGEPGRITNGAPGSKGAAGGRLIGAFWYGRDGTGGSAGANGGGGGGGGGGGASDNNIDDFGASGGGGGAGGCAAPSGGGGGYGGGGSFGIYLIDASPTIATNLIQRGAGGMGGAGGTGGRGQDGGGASNGGNGFENGGAGGDGGAGGHGGHGGGGGGGAGGLSVGIYRSSGASVPILSGNTFSGGTGGAGGPGGVSAPTAPAPVDDGNDGPTGDPGTVADTAVCAAPGSC
jgi:hypothetical protein